MSCKEIRVSDWPGLTRDLPQQSHRRSADAARNLDLILHPERRAPKLVEWNFRELYGGAPFIFAFEEAWALLRWYWGKRDRTPGESCLPGLKCGRALVSENLDPLVSRSIVELACVGQIAAKARKYLQPAAPAKAEKLQLRVTQVKVKHQIQRPVADRTRRLLNAGVSPIPVPHRSSGWLGTPQNRNSQSLVRFHETLPPPSNYDSSRLVAWTFGVTLGGKECGTFGSEHKHGPLGASVAGRVRRVCAVENAAKSVE